MSVIVGRALPDVRDGLKLVHCCISIQRTKLTDPRQGLPVSVLTPSVRCLAAITDGDASVYDALVRMAHLSLRYMMVDCDGNFGSVDGYPAAAYRYTEAKLSKISMEMLRDIDKDTVGFRQTMTTVSRNPPFCPREDRSLLCQRFFGYRCWYGH